MGGNNTSWYLNTTQVNFYLCLMEARTYTQAAQCMFWKLGSLRYPNKSFIMDQGVYVDRSSEALKILDKHGYATRMTTSEAPQKNFINWKTSWIHWRVRAHPHRGAWCALKTLAIWPQLLRQMTMHSYSCVVRLFYH